MEAPRHVDIRVTGRVQGVSFRASARKAAMDLGVCGFAQNRPDGSVYMEAEGSDANVEAFIAWCRRGPEAARVDAAVVTDGAMKGYSVFEIVR